MKRYVIGKTDGPWRNFLPPIHGGSFRPYTPNDVDDYPEPVLLSASISTDSESSVPSSPTLSASSGEEPFLVDPSMRRRRVEHSMASSMSSIADVEPVPKIFDADYLTRKAIEHDLATYPSLDPLTQREIIIKFRELGERIKDAGLFNCNYWAYAREVLRYSLLFTASMVCLKYGWYKVSAFCMGFFWHQLVFTAHDAGHMGITHNFQVDTIIGVIIADFIGGLSLGWWKRSHNVGAPCNRTFKDANSNRFTILSPTTPSTIPISSTSPSLPSATSSSRACTPATTTASCPTTDSQSSWCGTKTTSTTRSCSLADSTSTFSPSST